MAESLRPALLVALVAAILASPRAAAALEVPQLLFRVSADNGFVADHAGGDAVPNFQDKVKIVPDGVQGGGVDGGGGEHGRVGGGAGAAVGGGVGATRS